MKLLIQFSLCLLLIACKGTKSRIWEAADSDMMVQLADIKKDNGRSAFEYRLRVMPEENLLNAISDEGRLGMMYHMDSCLYLLKGDKKVYPAVIEPIANGTKNKFEYLIIFNDEHNADSVKMIYQDKHLNRRIYAFSLIRN